MTAATVENVIDRLLVKALTPIRRALAPILPFLNRHPTLRFLLFPWQILYLVGALWLIDILVRDASAWAHGDPGIGDLAHMDGNTPLAWIPVPALRGVVLGGVIIGAVVTGYAVPLWIVRRVQQAWRKAGEIGNGVAGA